ncbi:MULTISPECIES: MFS transporter [unclassified Dysgonomonas]|uniref:MFS transporter n=1 Tax=unclassified Dysgonomonas TaxID=2630389 RepID=UPI0024742790|nr:MULTISPECIES: MFS transporter [unclassified Dysgonomonas]
MENWKKKFALIWSGELVSTLTSSVVGYAVIFWLSLETGSAEVLAFATIASMLPQILIGLFTGVLIDRWSRKWTMIFSDSFIAITTLILCIMFHYGKIEVWQIYILLAFRSVGNAFYTPAMQASIPLIAPESQLMRVAGVNQIIVSLSSIAGPALAALLIVVMDMTFILLLDVAGAIIACVALLCVKIPNPEREDATEKINVLKEIKDGLKAISSVKGLTWLFVFDIIAIALLMPASALFPLMTVKYFMGDTFSMSIVETAWGVGMLIGGAFLGLKIMKSTNKALLIITTLIVLGLTFLFSGILPASGFVVFVILSGIGGICGAIFWSAFTVILQTMIDTSTLGRVFSIMGSLNLIPAIPGLLATGFIAEYIGLNSAFLYTGISICIVGCTMLFIPSVRELGRETKRRGNQIL